MIAPFRHYLSVILFALSFCAFAQEFSVSGKVMDSNRNPIELANVVILKEDGTSFIKGASTDEKGIF